MVVVDGEVDVIVLLYWIVYVGDLCDLIEGCVGGCE